MEVIRADSGAEHFILVRGHPVLYFPLQILRNTQVKKKHPSTWTPEWR